MSFEDGYFKTLFSNSVLEHIDNVDLALAEAYRVLAPKGRFIFTTPTPLFRNREYYYWRKLFWPIGLDCIGKQIALREDKIYHHVSIRSFEGWDDSLKSVGFQNVEKYEYIPKVCSLLISKFSGASRIRGLTKSIGTFMGDELFSNAYNDLPEGDWLEFYRKALQPYLRPCADGENGCGQVIIAYK